MADSHGKLTKLQRSKCPSWAEMYHISPNDRILLYNDDGFSQLFDLEMNPITYCTQDHVKPTHRTYIQPWWVRLFSVLKNKAP